MHTAQRSLCQHAVCFNLPTHTIRQAKTAHLYSQSRKFGTARLRDKAFRSFTAGSARRDSLPVVTQPWSSNDVDRELWAVLDLASDEELEGVHDMLFGEQLL